LDFHGLRGCQKRSSTGLRPVGFLQEDALSLLDRNR
jgi:hypothetical protein